jgi:hypothetical protein
MEEAMTISWKQDNPLNKPKRVIETIAGLPGKFGDRVLHVKADGSHINSKGRPITFADTGNNRNRRVEKRDTPTGTSRGSFGPGLGREHDGNKPRHVYAMQQVDRVAAELRAQSLATYRDGEKPRVGGLSQAAPVRPTWNGFDGKGRRPVRTPQFWRD